ncbi:DUF2066 domain-containing protein [Mesorhizobium sp. ZMM04-5]|uniref:DUF2066 domain-containing protein n=1 Tax=Mesorhizobium marinum TaxID=3228790 RepID=A0ABV3QZT5_9HYPH
MSLAAVLCRLWFLTLAALVAGTGSLRASGLYTAETVTSGTAEPRRSIGFAACLRRVLVRVSGDPGLDANPLVRATDAAGLIARFSFGDRLAGIPIHDEQGSYDRPHDLTCVFDPGKVDALLERLGRKPWLARPRLAAVISVRGIKGERSMLASNSDGARADDMRASLAAAAEAIALPLVLPAMEQLSDIGLAAEGPVADDIRLGSLARSTGADLALSGALAWSDAALGWIADWRIAAEGVERRWQVRGVGFDDAFRNGVQGAAKVLSGNGQP